MHWRKSILMIHKILRFFIKSLTVDDKYYLFNKENLTQPIQMQLSKAQKKISQIFIAFLKSILNFKHLPKKMTLIAYVFPQIPVPKIMVR